jgi:OOP family OmpA-OmpF porin
MINRLPLSLLCAAAVLVGAGCVSQPLPRQAPLAVSPTSFGSGEQRDVTNVFVVTDASGTTYVEKTFPEAKALSESFVKALPEASARAKTKSYNVGAIGFGGKDRVQAALAPFDRSGVLRTVESVNTMGEVTGRGGTTPIHAVIEEIGAQLEGKSGTTAVLLFSDGVADDPQRALTAAQALVEGYRDPVCFHGVRVGDNPDGAAFMKQLSEVSSCGSARSAASVANPSTFQRFAKGVVVGAAPLPPVAAAPPACSGTIRLRGIEFGFDKADIDGAGAAVLDIAAEQLRQCGDLKVRIEGHTDSIGTEAYNRGLSERRATAVRDYIGSAGISGSRLSPQGFGEADPVASNDTSDGRARNRRVELKPQ